MKKIFLRLFCIIFILFFGHILFFIYYPISQRYDAFFYYNVDNNSAIVDLSFSKSGPIYARIEFKSDNQVHEKFMIIDRVVRYKYDSLFSPFGYYNNRYERSNQSAEGSRIFYDKKEQKNTFQYQDQEFSITQEGKFFEYNNLKILLPFDKVTKIIIRKNEPLEIIIQNRWSFDPPILPPYDLYHVYL